MVCNICKKNEATIHLTEIVNNQMVEVHLCETCAEEKGTDFKTHFNFSELLSGLADMGGMFKTEERTSIACSACAMSYEEFAKTGRLGCSECYRSLGKILLPLIRRVQRSATHIGKRPGKLSGEATRAIDLRDLKDRLRKCVEEEDFEEAARVRDEIKTLEEKARKGKKENG
jgi:protein arginine kinase activator